MSMSACVSTYSLFLLACWIGTLPVHPFVLPPPRRCQSVCGFLLGVRSAPQPVTCPTFANSTVCHRRAQYSACSRWSKRALDVAGGVGSQLPRLEVGAGVGATSCRVPTWAPLRRWSRPAIDKTAQCCSCWWAGRVCTWLRRESPSRARSIKERRDGCSWSRACGARRRGPGEQDPCSVRNDHLLCVILENLSSDWPILALSWCSTSR